MDRRLIPANERVAALHLKGKVEAEQYLKGAARQVTASEANLLRAPGGKRDRQLLMGERVTAYEDRAGYAFVQAARDGYVGYVDSLAIGPAQSMTHWIASRSTHIYSTANFKSPETGTLSFGCEVCARSQAENFVEIGDGQFLPLQHLLEIGEGLQDMVSVAEMFLGTPYLWGGNSGTGIDCSGLLQAACLACGIPCPRDSDQQEAQLGKELPKETPLERGDLVFWKGHVGLMLDGEILLHANAHHMVVAVEPLTEAISRISAKEFGDVTAFKRL
ncbi:C40 family peptidase [Pseudohalocynthiibacter sp. F2068]|jgi:cell wall-associated NlpC family hydrolase|uniref:C40 family peptidase n=1 Tax=Pseudohalocynthiibacter sp. F2068 TaxID=2926418 RepID=UPI001FF3CABB|nr:C40 family peptidase [Pseudohalocynthiibacter sp. F2068]MCK0102687.1 C40 family peptidase [Pseudohalocynthiibacter sp. F2068]